MQCKQTHFKIIKLLSNLYSKAICSVTIHQIHFLCSSKKFNKDHIDKQAA